jgi:hypothetical protein
MPRFDEDDLDLDDDFLPALDDDLPLKGKV